MSHSANEEKMPSFVSN